MIEQTSAPKAVEYPWPVPPGYQNAPVWTGKGFQIGDKHEALLSFEVGESNWTDELTQFHEDNANDNHFIDVASRQSAVNQLKRFVKNDSSVILEIGCSSGFMLKEIKKAMPKAFVIGSDYVRGPLEQLATTMPDMPLVQFNLLKCPLPETSVDAIVILNVLEHIQDDVEALRQIYRLLKPGGVVVIEVPADPNIYDVYDKLLLHFRRYSPASLSKVVKEAGFEVAWRSHLAFFIFPGFWAVKQRNKRFLKEGDAVQKKVVADSIKNTRSSRLFSTLMNLELALGQKISYPFGIRCLMTCVKK